MRSEFAVRVYAALASSPLRGAGLPSTAAQLAQSLGTTVGTLSAFLSGSYRPGRRAASTFTAERIAQVLRVPAGALDGAACPCCGRQGEPVALEHIHNMQEALNVVITALDVLAGRLGALPVGQSLRARIEDLRMLAIPIAD